MAEKKLVEAMTAREDDFAQWYTDVVKKAELSKDGKAVIVTNTNNDLIATIPGRSCSDYREIKEGTKLMLWYDIVALSMPGKTVATKARILD